MSGVAESADQHLNTTVLVVEDEHMLRHAVAKMLRKRGFEVLEAADGSTAIDLVRANKDTVDLILLDLTIPGASPREIVLEAAQARPEIKVLLTSAYSQEMIAATMSAPQICGFVRKPFQFADLLKSIQSSMSP
jgi:DNA-binding NtrC family response regulator